jgi:hypothetical protein
MFSGEGGVLDAYSLKFPRKDEYSKLTFINRNSGGEKYG